MVVTMDRMCTGADAETEHVCFVRVMMRRNRVAEKVSNKERQRQR